MYWTYVRFYGGNESGRNFVNFSHNAKARHTLDLSNNETELCNQWKTRNEHMKKMMLKKKITLKSGGISTKDGTI